MTQEDKELLLVDLCARLPYGVKVAYKNRENKEGCVKLGYGNIGYIAELGRGWWTVCKPYLRPVSSMTEEEKEELCNFVAASMFASRNKNPLFQLTREALYADFFNKHHIDYRDLIPKGLAIEAPEGMY